MENHLKSNWFWLLHSDTLQLFTYLPIQVMSSANLCSEWVENQFVCSHAYWNFLISISLRANHVQINLLGNMSRGWFHGCFSKEMVPNAVKHFFAYNTLSIAHFMSINGKTVNQNSSYLFWKALFSIVRRPIINHKRTVKSQENIS